MAALSFLAAVLLVGSGAATLVTIHNDVPRVDTAGHILNAHDGSVQFFNGTYFLYGTVYENCTQARIDTHVLDLYCNPTSFLALSPEPYPRSTAPSASRPAGTIPTRLRSTRHLTWKLGACFT